MSPRLAPFTTHLAELRTRLVRYLLFLAVATLIGFYLTPQFISFFLPPEGTLVVLGPLDAFMVRLTLALLIGFILSAPELLIEIFAFVRPAFQPHEQWVVVGTAVVAMLLFAMGVGLAYYLLPISLSFLLGFAGKEFQTTLAADRYFGFIFWFFVVFGISFELPLVLLFLMQMGILSLDQLRKSRRFAFLAIVIFAAVITPTQDVFTLSLLTIPLYLLFEITLVVGRFILRGKSAAPLQKG